MTDKDLAYLKRLRVRMDEISDAFERAVFFRVCAGLQQYKQGRAASKYVTKAEILEYLVGRGFMKRTAAGKLPDDRRVREAARELLKCGFPIMATSAEKGYFIAESGEEIDLPEKQNYDRAVATLAAHKGYKKARLWVTNQPSIFG